MAAASNLPATNFETARKRAARLYFQREAKEVEMGKATRRETTSGTLPASAANVCARASCA
jgi:hypothetical protein